MTAQEVHSPLRRLSLKLIGDIIIIAGNAVKGRPFLRLPSNMVKISAPSPW